MGVGQVYQMAERLRHRLAAVALGEPGQELSEIFIKSVKSKALYFWIQRIIVYVTQCGVDQMQAAMQDPYLHSWIYRCRTAQFPIKLNGNVTVNY